MLELHGIDRSFGDRKVLDDVGFTVRPGGLTGFVGRNGSGKTTTMRIILGVLSADAGTVTLDGEPLGPEQRRTFGYMPEERGLYPKMTVLDQLVYLSRLRGFDKQEGRDRALSLLDRLGLAERATDPVEKLSLGNQQRAQIAVALVHEPSLLVLDEPFSGLDPVAIEVVLDVLAEQAARGVPVLFSSHQLDLVERLCDDLVIIADGQIKAAGPREQLRAERSRNRYEILSTGDVGWLRGTPGVTVIEFDGGYALFEATDDAVADRVLRTAMDGATVRSFGPRRASLAEIFRGMVAA